MGLSCIAAACLWHRPAQACSVAQPVDHSIDTSSSDATPPAAPEVAGVEVQRGVGAKRTGCGQYSESSCDSLGFLTIHVAPGSDDTTSVADLGYALRLIEGDLQEGFSVPATPFRLQDGSITIVWVDDGLDRQQAFSLTLGLRAIDGAGNQSEEIEFEVSDGGSPAGCSTHARTPVADWTVLAIALLLAYRRRRRASV